MGAKFSGGGATVFYDDGIKTAASGTTGTQRNEFEAAIKSVTSSTTVGAVFLYDTSQDSDGGKWRKGNRCKGLSWFDEPTLPAGTGANQWNSATRSARSEFPAMSLIVADNAAGSETITIYDLDDVAAPMWLVFQMDGASESSRNFSGRAGENANSLFALNGRVMWGLNADLASGGVCIADFASDEGLRNAALASYTETGRVLSERNSAILPKRISGDLIVNGTINDVAATVLEGAEIGALGLPIPTVAVGTAGGCSIILANGTVNSSSNTNSIAAVNFHNGSLWWSRGVSTYAIRQSRYSELFAASFGNSAGSYSASSGIPALLGSSVFSAADGAFGNSSGLTRLLENTGNPAESAVAYITSDYNTGYMVGDIRGAWLANSSTDGAGATVHDRSVKGNDLTEQGSVNTGDVATDAELTYCTNFGSSNYLSLAYTSDLDFTNTMSVMFWVKDYSNSKDIYGIGTRSSTLSQSIYIDGGYDYRWTLTSNGTTEQQFEIPEAGTLNDWTFICFTLNAGAVRGYKNGQNIAASNGTFTGNIFSQATDTEGLEIGKGLVGAGSSGGKLSLFRISATAPTPQQIADIYAAEKPLFQAGAKCLLSQVTHNSVNDLAYDKSSDLLYVGTTSADAGDSVSTYRGLERVDTKDGQDLGWDGASAHFVAAAGGVVGYARNGSATGSGVILDLPALDVRAELNEGDDKLPDDGKFHFSASIDGATPAVIGNIYVDEGDTVFVRAKIVGQAYQDQGGWRTTSITEQSFSRDIGGDIGARTASYVLRDEAHADFDSVLQGTTANNCIELKVTGKSGVRMVWNAEVEVVRGSDTGKKYER